MNVYFTYESRDTPKSFSVFFTVKDISELNMERTVKLKDINLKISLRRSRSPDNGEFNPFTLLFCRGRLEIYKDL